MTPGRGAVLRVRILAVAQAPTSDAELHPDLMEKPVTKKRSFKVRGSR
jgi:hypothetical protein